MRLLHITANLGGGISVVLKELVAKQNEVESFISKVLVIGDKSSKNQWPFFEYLEGQSFKSYIESFKPDVVIFHSHYYFEYLKLYKILIKNEIPYFIEPHGAFGKNAQRKSKYKKIVANELILKRFVKNAKGFIFLNENEKKDAVFNTKNDLVIHNGIDVNDVSKEFVKNETSCFYFIGRYDIVHKGLDVLFDAIDIIEKKGMSIELKMYGLGTLKEVAYIDKRIQNYKNVKAVNCGVLEKEKQQKVLEQCGIMILTSRYEGFPMTILEAWKYGNPCIVTPGTNVYDEIIENGLGWGTELNAPDIANTLLLAYKDYLDNRSFYVNKLKNYVETNYNWSQIALSSYVLLSNALKIQTSEVC